MMKIMLFAIIFFAVCLVILFTAIPGCDQIDDAKHLMEQIAELKEVQQRLEQEEKNLSEKLSQAIKETEELGQENKKLTDLLVTQREKNSRNLDQLFR